MVLTVLSIKRRQRNRRLGLLVAIVVFETQSVCWARKATVMLPCQQWQQLSNSKER